MAYIGVSPSNGVRRVFDYTATAGQTSFSGSDNNSQTLAYTDSAYIDVYQNGVLLIPSDYTATTGTSVVLDTGATVSDSVQIVVFDVFSVADTVSKVDGGTFESNISIGGTLGVTGNQTNSGNLTVSGAFTSQGIDDNADATAITIDSNERVAVGHSTTGGANLAICDGANSAIQFYCEVDTDTNLIQHYDQTSTTYMNAQYSGNSHKFLAGTTERLRIDNDGSTHLSTNVSGNYALQVINDGNNLNRYGISIQCGEYTPSTVNYLMGFQDGNGNSVGSITFNNAGQTQFNTSSDYRLKENVTEDWNATTRLKELKPCRFNFKKYPNVTVDGFLAHEVSSIVPEAVSGKKDAVDADGNAVMQGIDQSKLVPLLVKTIQELEARITALESK